MKIDKLMLLMPAMSKQDKYDQAVGEESQSFLTYLLALNEGLPKSHKPLEEEYLSLIHPHFYGTENFYPDDAVLDLVKEEITSNGLTDNQAMTVKTELTLNEQSNFSKEVLELVSQLTIAFQKLDEQNVKQIAPRILNILKRFTLFLNKANQDESLLNILAEEMDETDFKLCESLLKSFNKRTSFSAVNPYKYESEVRVDDIANWLNNALKNQDISLENISKQPAVHIGHSSNHISAVEQYIIHLNKGDRIERIQAQLVGQISTVLKQGHFLKGQDLSQLSFTLNPNNLGKINIQLAQIDGELIVKIITTSTATKKILEANAHQLKAVFAPYNIIVERQGEEVEDLEQTEDDQEEYRESMTEEEATNDQEDEEDRMTRQDDTFKRLLSELHE